MKTHTIIALCAVSSTFIGCQSTTLPIAAREGRTQLVQRMLKKGVDPNLPDSSGRIALHQAALNDRVDIMRSLIASGADVNRADREGVTPLMCAAWEGRVTAAELLLQNGAIVNAKDNAGSTALTRAAERGYTVMADFLLSHDAAINEKNKRGHTPIDFAADNGQEAMVQLLINRGANVNNKDNNGYFVTDRAANNTIMTLLCNAGAKVKNLAPSSPAGKTFIFSTASGRIVRSLGERRGTHRGGYTSYYWPGEDPDFQWFTYKITGKNTAVLCEECDAEGTATTWHLRFDTPTSGKITRKESAWHPYNVYNAGYFTMQ